MADGFLGRWSQRKQAVRDGKALPEPPPAPAPAARPVVAMAPVASDRPGQAPPALAAEPPAAPPLPSMEDVQALTPESNYAPFVAREVAPAVRNAAMKKLFTDPHYNVMDRLDIYIDDYSRPDPLPLSMLRQMASAKFLNLFDEEERAKDKPASSTLPAAVPHPHESGAEPSAPLPAADPLTDHTPAEPGTHHDHPDLRLQPNHATGAQEPGRGPE